MSKIETDGLFDFLTSAATDLLVGKSSTERAEAARRCSSSCATVPVMPATAIMVRVVTVARVS
jgi:hypothetical protein